MYKAKVSFSGIAVSMAEGDVGNVPADMAKDLLNAGYIEEVSPAKEEAKAKTNKRGTKNE